MGLDIYIYRINCEAYHTVKAINNKHIHYDEEEIGYFRNFWSLLKMVNYTNDDYAKHVELTIDTLIFIRDKSKSILENVESFLTNDKHLIIEKSIFDTDEQVEEIIVLNNTVFDSDLEDECDYICNSVYKEADYAATRKFKHLYHMINKILNETNFAEDMIMIRADW